MRIDLHTHILPRTWPSWTQRSGYAGWIELAHERPGCARMTQTTSVDGSTPPRVFREICENCWDPTVRLAEMTNAGVTTQVLSTVPVMFNHWAKAADARDLHRLLNDHIAEICRVHAEPGVPPFIGLGVVPMQDADMACAELDRCVRDLGMAGLQIGTNVGGANLDDARVQQVLAHAQSLDAAVFVHPWDMLCPERTEKYWLRWLIGMPTETAIAVASMIFSGSFDMLPRLRMCFAHAGGPVPSLLGRFEHGHACRPDLVAIDNPTPPSRYLAHRDDRGVEAPARFWVDSLTHDPAILREALRVFGEARVALGSDYPFPLGEEKPGAMIDGMEDLAAAVKERLLFKNALEFLGGQPAEISEAAKRQTTK